MEASQSDPHKLWKIFDDLLGRGREPVSSAIDVEVFNQFFCAESCTADALAPMFTHAPPGVSFWQFRPLTSDDVISAIRQLPDKTSAADPIPTSMLKQTADVVAPFVTELFNRSLSTGHFPAAFKEAFITPIVKKPGLDAASGSSHHPISNLSVLSKPLELLVVCHLMEYLSSTDLIPPLQSGYQQGHSTKTAVLRVLSDIFQAVDNGYLAALVLLDMSAAFDTVDHSIFLRRLHLTFGIDDTAHGWFQSYLSSRKQYVRCSPSKSLVTYLVCSVPQGSALGPILFVLYTIDLLMVIESHRLSPHMYANDTQVYGSCHPSAVTNFTTKISYCVEATTSWMRSNRLRPNPEKTEVLWCATT